MRNPYEDGKVAKGVEKFTNWLYEDKGQKPMTYLEPYTGKLSKQLLTPRVTLLDDVKLMSKKLMKLGKFGEEL